MALYAHPFRYVGVQIIVETLFSQLALDFCHVPARRHPIRWGCVVWKALKFYWFRWALHRKGQTTKTRFSRTSLSSGKEMVTMERSEVMGRCQVRFIEGTRLCSSYMYTWREAAEVWAGLVKDDYSSVKAYGMTEKRAVQRCQKYQWRYPKEES